LLSTQAEIGWKLIFGRVLLQPWLGYSINFGNINTPEYPATIGRSPYGMIDIGLGLGFVF
jgi:hypothetical protein